MWGYPSPTFVKERLSWLERSLTYRRQLKVLPKLVRHPTDGFPGEEIVGLLPGRLMAKDPLLFALTSHRLIALEPLWSTKVHVWMGEAQVRMFQIENDRRLIHVHVTTKPNDETTQAQFEIAFHPKQLVQATAFWAIGNALAFAGAWGDLDRVNEIISTAMTS